MTEFMHIGTHCASSECKQFDFLPFQCGGCGKSFCLDHRMAESHNCPAIGTKITNEIVPRCPICNMRLEIPAKSTDREINLIFDGHIQSGCKTRLAVKSKIQRCSKSGCANKSLLRCKNCSMPFCGLHRYDYEHSCPVTQGKKIKKPERMKRRKKKGKVNMSSKTKQLIRQIKRGRPYKKVRNSIKFQNCVSKPRGNLNLEVGDRFYVDAFFPLDSKMNPVHCYFKKTFKVGRVLDEIARMGQIDNMNNQDVGDKMLNLFSMPNGFCLPHSDTLVEVQRQGILKSGDPVILERGSSLPMNFIEKAGEEMGGMSCVVM